MSGSCSSCRFFSSLTSECRRNPPTVVAGLTPKGPGVFGFFPPVNKQNGWCGHYETEATTTAEECPNCHVRLRCD